VGVTVQTITSDKPTGNDIERYRANDLSEQEGVSLYSTLAEIERDAHLAELYQCLASASSLVQLSDRNTPVE
jgi:hypothetical protein